MLELKADATPQEAIAQIKNKEYCEKLRKENVKDILAVGLSYDTGKKEHHCIITDITYTTEPERHTSACNSRSGQ